MNDDREYRSHSGPLSSALHESVNAFRDAWQNQDFTAAQNHFHSLWETLEPWLCSRSQEKGLKQEETEDVVADVFIGLYDILQRGQAIGNVRALVVTILDHRIVDFWRKRYGRSRESIDPTVDTEPREVRAADTLSFDWDEVRSDDAPMHEAVDDQSFLAAANSILTALSDSHRRVLILRFGRGLSVSETASALGLSVDQVKKETAKALNSARGIAVEQKHIEREVLK